MAEVPLQLVVLRYLSDHLEQTTGVWENGDPLVLAGKCFRGRKFFSDDDFESEGDALISILEAPRPLIADAAGVEKVKRKENWTILLQGWTKDDKKNPSDPAYWLKAAVEKQLSRLVELSSEGQGRWPEFRMGGLVNQLIVGQGLVRPPEQQITKFTMFYIPLIIDLVTDISKPYSTIT